MKHGPTAALKLLPKYLSVVDKPIRARELLAIICLGEGWSSQHSAALELGEKWEKAFLVRAQSELNELQRLGRFSLFGFNSASPQMLQGAAFPEPKDAFQVFDAKQARSRYAEYINELQRLTPIQFESLCAGILRLLGVQDPKLTPISGDEGIDFFGRLDLRHFLAPNPVFVNFVTQMSVWLIGQAKHFKVTQVSTPDLRDLIGAMELAKSGLSVSVQSQLGSQHIRLCDPVYYLFFTTGRISADAWKLIEKSGIIGMDGEMVAAFLADNNVGVQADQFASTLFQDWLSQFT